jgi:hypothetical protein
VHFKGGGGDVCYTKDADNSLIKVLCQRVVVTIN